MNFKECGESGRELGSVGCCWCARRAPDATSPGRCGQRWEQHDSSTLVAACSGGVFGGTIKLFVKTQLWRSNWPGITNAILSRATSDCPPLHNRTVSDLVVFKIEISLLNFWWMQWWWLSSMQSSCCYTFILERMWKILRMGRVSLMQVLYFLHATLTISASI